MTILQSVKRLLCELFWCQITFYFTLPESFGLTQDVINFVFTTPISRVKTVKEGKNGVADLENSWQKITTLYNLHLSESLITFKEVGLVAPQFMWSLSRLLFPGAANDSLWNPHAIMSDKAQPTVMPLPWSTEPYNSYYVQLVFLSSLSNYFWGPFFFYEIRLQYILPSNFSLHG